MGLSRRQFTKEFKLAAIQRLEMGASLAEVARAFEVNPSVLHRWRREVRQGPGNVFPGLGKRRWEEGQVAQLERKIGQQALEIDFLKGCLQRIDEQRKLQALAGKPLSTSRSGFYRFPPDPPGPDRDMKLRDAIQRIALEFPSYGWPRMTAELRRRGWAVNHKRVYRLMRQDNLLCLRRRKFVVTTDSGHGLPVYPNLARTLTLTGLDQLWVADITYIRLELEFVYLAVILDAFSRRVIGWALDRTLEAALTIQALHMALARRRSRSAGLVHHSDRGVQYASADYTQLLKDHGIRISMSRKANPWDNAACESFMKTLKYEEVYRSEYRHLAEAQASIGMFLEKVYNQKRLHSALGYLPPVEFERELRTQTHKEAAARQLPL
jgi:transposase InsO family protein/transposase-like protein